MNTIIKKLSNVHWLDIIVLAFFGVAELINWQVTYGWGGIDLALAFLAVRIIIYSFPVIMLTLPLKIMSMAVGMFMTLLFFGSLIDRDHQQSSRDSSINNEQKRLSELAPVNARLSSIRNTEGAIRKGYKSIDKDYLSRERMLQNEVLSLENKRVTYRGKSQPEGLWFASNFCSGDGTKTQKNISKRYSVSCGDLLSKKRELRQLRKQFNGDSNAQAEVQKLLKRIALINKKYPVNAVYSTVRADRMSDNTVINYTELMDRLVIAIKATILGGKNTLESDDPLSSKYMVLFIIMIAFMIDGAITIGRSKSVKLQRSDKKDDSQNTRNTGFSENTEEIQSSDGRSDSSESDCINSDGKVTNIEAAKRYGTKLVGATKDRFIISKVTEASYASAMSVLTLSSRMDKYLTGKDDVAGKAIVYVLRKYKENDRVTDDWMMSKGRCSKNIASAIKLELFDNGFLEKEGNGYRWIDRDALLELINEKMAA